MTLQRLSTAIGLLTGMFLFVGVASAFAQTDNDEPIAGYVDLSEVEAQFDEPAHLEITIEGALLEMLARLSQDARPQFAEIVDNLSSIQVRGFSIPATDDDLTGRLQSITDYLEAQNWRQMIHFREDDGQFRLYRQDEDDSISGLTLVTANPGDEEVFFVNIAGSIHPDDLSTLGRELDIEELEHAPTDSDM